ncbi:MAG: hypothetical protein OHK93_002049 [Ramalina farinacea]|uniref:Uncharacterized protein n=1 Tax=Ramalina farinacea TaxID=258253 RepID=A0AA43TWU7_9LECA|nr:hypothetical protein [Ramalina farinacea]
MASAPQVFHIILTGRSLEKTKSATAVIETAVGAKGRLTALHLDVTDLNSIQQAAAAVEKDFGRLDVLINNAAIACCVENDLQKRLWSGMATNVIGPALVSDAFRPLLLKSPHPYSIHVSSGAGSITRSTDGTSQMYSDPIPNGETYGITKAALNRLAMHEAMSYRSIKTFAMSPGFVVSNLRCWSDEAKTGWGKAGDPMVSGETLLSIVQGKRDGERYQLVHKDGVYPW